MSKNELELSKHFLILEFSKHLLELSDARSAARRFDFQEIEFLTSEIEYLEVLRDHVCALLEDDEVDDDKYNEDEIEVEDEDEDE